MYDSLMYSDCCTINATEIAEENKKSVLYKLRTTVNGLGVVNAVVKSFVINLNVASPASNATAGGDGSSWTGHEPPQCLESDKDVQWVMEVICYGLSLPILTGEQHEAVRDCVHIYHEWMNAMVPAKARGRSIPTPIRDDPNRYFRTMLQHLYNIFKRRPNPIGSKGGSFTNTSGNQDLNSSDIVSRQAVLCHRILRQLESICEDYSSVIDKESWSSILIFLLAINDTLLATPTERDDIGSNLCQRTVSSLFEVWLMACQRCFPTPSFWKTFHELCITLRHRQDVVDQWSRVCIALTQRLVQLGYPSSATSGTPSPSPVYYPVLNEMDQEVVSQTWFRFLHAIGNPVDLSSPATIARTLRLNGLPVSSGAAESGSLAGHASLNDLPTNFKRAMKGLSWLVNTFLGAPYVDDRSESPGDISSISPSVPRRLGRSSVSKPPGPLSNMVRQLGNRVNSQHSGSAPSMTNSSNFSESQNLLPPPSQPSSTQPPPSPMSSEYRVSSSRPKVNSVLNILGNWLFSASLLGSEMIINPDDSGASLNKDHRTNSSSSLNANEFVRKGSSVSSHERNSTTELGPDNFEAGQAEAMGTLCRLFCSKRTDEEIFPVYLARFYIALQHGLSVKEPLRYQVISSILINSTKIFQLDLNGVNILIPHYLHAMELVICNTSRPSSTELRRAAINLMLSLLTYPLHFSDLPIKDNLSDAASTLTFQSLRPRLINLMMNALRTEKNDSLNAQLLLAGFLTTVQDAAASEAANETRMDYERRSSSSIENQQNHESPESPSVNWSEHNTEPSSLLSGDFSQFSDAPFGKEGIPDTARGLFARTLSLVCNYLVTNSRNDTQFSLAALEVLAGLARVRLGSPDAMPNLVVECKRTTRWICEYIVSQCSRPPPSHSKDMHSTIVAAYQCLTVWFHEHAYLLQDKECLSNILEVIELGISGSKSKSGGSVTLKATKELKPASMRVREAAESLLTCLMNHFGSCPPAPCPPDSIIGTFLMDEVSLLKHLKIAHNVTQEDAYKYYRYFVADGSLILSILNEPFTNKTVVIIRSAFGKYCWSLSSQLLPSCIPSKVIPDVIPRPLPNDGPKGRHKFSFKFFPDSVERIPLTKLDLVVPTLDSLVNESAVIKAGHEMAKKRLEQQCTIEKQSQQRISAKSRIPESKEPSPTNTMDPVRLILSHFAFLTSDFFAGTGQANNTPSLIALDFKNPELRSNLNTLDLISTRTSDTIFIFYVRKGRVDPQEILNSVTSKHYVSLNYLDFLNNLGLVIDVHKHAGWTGNVSSAWKVQEEAVTPPGDDYSEAHLDHGGSAYDGLKKLVYWADISHEMAFIVPSGRLSEEDSFSVDGEMVKIRPTLVRADNLEGGDGYSMSSGEGTSISSHTYSDSSRNSWRNKSKQLSLMTNIGCDTKVLVFWLESIDDQNSLPIETLLHTTRTGVENSLCKDYFLITVHPLKNGLFRIDLMSSNARTPFALPLIDNHVVSKRILSSFVRLTCLNLCRRRRLDADSYQPAHVKRRLKVQDISNKFRLNLEEAEFYNTLFY